MDRAGMDGTCPDGGGVDGGIGCLPCPEHTYKVMIGNFICQSCHVGSSSLATASVNDSVCKCNVDYEYMSSDQSCQICGEDHYKVKTASQAHMQH